MCDTTKHVLLRALDRWASLWISVTRHLPTDELKGLGIARIAPELALLMRRVLEVLGTPAAEGSDYCDGKIRYDTAHLHEFVRRHGLPGHPAMVG